MSTLTATARATAPAHLPERVPTPRPKPTSRPDHLRVVRPNDRRRARLSPGTAVVLTGMLFALLFAVAIAQTILVQGQVKLDKLDTQLTTEQADYQRLRRDVAELESPERVVAEAQAQGMVAPDDLLYLQPSTPDPAADGDDPSVEPTEADPGLPPGDPNGAWSTVKPLLEAPAP
jgi:cell division protein FtsL